MKTGSMNRLILDAVKRLFQRQHRSSLIWIISTFFAVYTFVLIFGNLDTLLLSMQESSYEVGDTADRTIIPGKDIYYIDQNATEKAKQAKSSLVQPVFQFMPDVALRVEGRFQRFQALINSSQDNALPANQAVLEIESQMPELFSREFLIAFLESPQIREAMTAVRESITRIYSFGFIELPSYRNGFFDSGYISLAAEGQDDSEVLLSSMPTLSNLEDFILANDSVMPFVKEILSVLLEENYYFDIDQTISLRESAAASVEPIERVIPKDQPIIRKWREIRAEDLEKLEIYSQQNNSLNWQTMLGFFLFLFAMLVSIIVLFLAFAQRLSPKQIVLLCLFTILYVILLLIAKEFLEVNSPFFSAVWVPIAAFTMLMAILISLPASFFFALFFSMISLLINEFNAFSFLYLFFSGVIGASAAYLSEKRIHLFSIVLPLSITNGFVLMLAVFFSDQNLESYGLALFFGSINALISVILQIGVLPLIEHILNAPTRFRLLELGDANSPLLKKMLVAAPGTFNHSMAVANLAESACRELGANPLLARVGAYYHDIGKIDQPQYFIENQHGDNKHDELKPSLSVTVIKAHVKRGVEKAHTIGLPQEVIDIIEQHHGNSLISYFYAQAVTENRERKDSVEVKDDVKEERFRYNGTVPQTKEAAVVMLADGIEAGSRTILKPTIKKLEKFVWDAILKRFEEGQLAESPLTFHELEVIKKVFVQILAGYYHSRIEYPGKVDEQ
jgi:putative nucleotidyltransferase with HDIG domain